MSLTKIQALEEIRADHGNYATDDYLPFWDDKDFVKLAVMNNGRNMEFVSERLKDDKEVAKLASDSHSIGISFCSDRIKNDYEFMREVVLNKPNAFQYASDSLKDNKKFVMEVVVDNHYSGNAFEYVSDRLKNDKEVAIAYIGGHAERFDWLPEEIRNDKEFYKQCLNEFSEDRYFIENSFQHTGSDIRYDRDIMLEVVKIDGVQLEHAMGYLKDDREVAETAVKSRYSAIVFVGEELKDDKEFMRMAVEDGNRYCFSYASDRLRDDTKFVNEVVSKDGRNFIFASERLRSDIPLIKKACEQVISTDNKSAIREIAEHITDPKIRDVSVETNDPLRVVNSIILKEELTNKLNSTNKTQSKGIKI